MKETDDFSAVDAFGLRWFQPAWASKIVRQSVFVYACWVVAYLTWRFGLSSPDWDVDYLPDRYVKTLLFALFGGPGMIGCALYVYRRFIR